MAYYDFVFPVSIEAETEQEARQKLMLLASDDCMHNDIEREDLWSLKNKDTKASEEENR